MHVHSADVCKVEHLLAMFISGKALQPLECRLRPRDGHVRWIRVSLSWIIPQEILQLAFVNISTEKETQAHSRQSQVLLQKILDTTQAAIFWKDAERRFIGVNKAFLEYYGFDSEQVLLGKNDEDMGWHSDPDPYKNDELRVLQGESTTRVPGMCFCRGENRHIVASKSPLYEDGKIVGLVGSFEDVTSEYMLRKDVVDLNAKLHAALKKERQANRAKSDFLLRMSHDMRTPLATIVGFSDLELKKHRDPGLAKVFSTIKACSNFLLAILSDILDLQKLSNGKIDVIPTICTGAHSAKSIESIIRPQAEAKNITFITHFNCTATNCYAQIDTRKVQQIIVNLLNNAVKYTQPGGTITWRNDICGENADSLVVTHVISDNGPGISKKFQASMYSPFTQEDHMSSSGSGLGLAIVKKLVDILGGNITCKSAPGQGTTFTVILPHQKATAADIAAFHKKNRTQHTAPTSLKGRKILICEDNVINSEILKEMLESEGVVCEQAFNGSEGVEKAKGRNYDIIMMDIRMPVMDGYQATREIREFDVDTPIVALSANVFADEIQNAFESGMDEFLEKPVIMSKMFSVLGQLLSPTPASTTQGPD
ncbi:response regulator [Desulfovibrio sp. UIB00]|uniref:response regulator n=1 Tax=Desulfovibrio sp. UIB00 TaxID=2804314 RepID=UPI001F0E9E47|nr:response regulator [Desulfovibrio sp. UIB00]